MNGRRSAVHRLEAGYDAVMVKKTSPISEGGILDRTHPAGTDTGQWNTNPGSAWLQPGQYQYREPTDKWSPCRLTANTFHAAH